MKQMKSAQSLSIGCAALFILCTGTPAIAGEFSTQALIVYNQDVQPLLDIKNQSLPEDDVEPELIDVEKCYHVAQNNLFGKSSEKKLNELDCAFTFTPSIMPDSSFKLKAHLSVGVPLLGPLEANCYGTISKNKLRKILFTEDAFPKGSEVRDMYQFKVDGCLNVSAGISYCIDIAKDGPRSGQAQAANADLKGIAILYGTGYVGDDPKAPPMMKCQAGWAAIIGGFADQKKTTRMLPKDRNMMINEYYTMYQSALATDRAERAKSKGRGGRNDD